MKEPPNSPYPANVLSGQPSVCTILRSGQGTRHPFTPSAQICGFSPSSRKWSIAAPREQALRPLDEHGHAGDDV